MLFKILRAVLKTRPIPFQVAMVVSVLVPSAVGAQPQRDGNSNPEELHSPDPGDTPSVDSPVVYRSFFAYYDHLERWLRSQSAMSPSNGVRLSKETARRYGLNDSEQIQLANICHSAVVALGDIRRQTKSYIEGARFTKAGTDPLVLREYSSKRALMLSEKIEELRSSLSAASWESLRSYLNNEYRKSIHAAPAFKKVTAQEDGRFR